jgi:hypothetical protein
MDKGSRIARRDGVTSLPVDAIAPVMDVQVSCCIQGSETKVVGLQLFYATFAQISRYAAQASLQY